MLDLSKVHKKPVAKVIDDLSYPKLYLFLNDNTPNIIINNKPVTLLRDKSLQKTRKTYKENKNVRPKTRKIPAVDPNKNREDADDYI